MTYLIDTQILIWLFIDTHKISPKTTRILKTLRTEF